MKKKILGGIAVIAIVAMAAVNINFNNINDIDGLSALSIANVEALASGESGTPDKCHTGITQDDSIQTFYCGECEFVSGKPSFWSSTSTC